LRDNTELRGILNAGHRRNAFVLRVEGDDHEPRRFSVWCPKVIAMIGKPHATLSGRSIVVELKRKTMLEKRERFTDGCLNDHLARKCARWAADNEGRLRSHQPSLPESLFNRTADNWIPLVTIADIAGSGWQETARQLAATAAARKDGDITSVLLLQAIRELFEEKNADRLSSEDMSACELRGQPMAGVSKWQADFDESGRQLAQGLQGAQQASPLRVDNEEGVHARRF